ncbi:MAG: ribosome silencing factor [Rhodospirillales bacterium]|nr:ribosome silencing factor [Rhodospirillales bacterium]
MGRLFKLDREPVGENAIARRKPTQPVNKKLLKLVEATLDDDKAIDVVVINLTGKTEIADFMVVASGTSNRQVGAMADHLRDTIKQSGHDSVAVEGNAQCDWVLIDAGDIIVHLFRPEVREFYGLEKMWEVAAPSSDAGQSDVGLTA